MDISQRHHFEPTRRLRLVLTCNLEIIAIISLSVLEILLRATNVFPVRSVTFSPDDVWINSTLDAGKHTMKWFAYSGDVSYAVVVALSFTLPPLFMLICELLRWKLVDDDVIRISAICVTCDVHSVTRRLVRFFGTFLAGILATMISVDVTKLMVGRLRPVFLDVCAINTTLLCNYCTNSTLCHVTNITSICSVSQCTQSDINVVRWARMSFPSFYAAITSYAACFMAVYSESILTKGLRCAVFGPFFSMSVVMGSLLCGLSRYALYYNYWTDVAVGFGFGTVISVYVGSTRQVVEGASA